MNAVKATDTVYSRYKGVFFNTKADLRSTYIYTLLNMYKAAGWRRHKQGRPRSSGKTVHFGKRESARQDFDVQQCHGEIGGNAKHDERVRTGDNGSDDR